MKQTFRLKLAWWVRLGIAVPLIVLNGWILLQVFNFFEPLINVIVVAIVLSFILNYPVNYLARRIQRTRAVLFVLLSSLFLFAVLGITLIPALIDQLDQLITHFPSLFASGSAQLQTLENWAQARRLPVDLSHLITQLEDRASTQLQAVSGDILRFFVDAIGRVLDLVVTFVLTFYLLIYGDRLWDGIFQWFPRDLGLQIRHSLRQNFHNYFVGQATMALLMGSAMTIAFLLLQVPFGLLFGMAIGVLALFPFGATLGVAITSALFLLQNVWLGVRVLVTAVVIQQIVENGIAPQLIGGFTGLNPAWILISLLFGAKVAGILGVVIAVPIASFIRSMGDYLRQDRSPRLLPESAQLPPKSH